MKPQTENPHCHHQPGPAELGLVKAVDPDQTATALTPQPEAARKPRVLLLEDMEPLAELLRENLLLCGFEVEVAFDGQTALGLLKSRTFDIALIDIDLPDLSGFEVATRACSAGYLRQTRVVFCTGGYSQERQAQALQFAGSGFIAKPFSIKTLLATISDARSASEMTRD